MDNTIFIFENQQDFSELLIQLLSPIIIALASILIFRLQSRKFKSMSDKMLSKYEEGLQSNLEVNFNTRYADVVSKAIDNQSDISNYYSTFWGLQYDEYLQYKRGHLSLECFGSWMLSRGLEFKEKNSSKTVYHQLTIKGWEIQKEAFNNIDSKFFDFIEKLKNQQITDKNELDNFFTQFIR